MKHQLQSKNWLWWNLSNERSKLWVWGVCGTYKKTGQACQPWGESARAAWSAKVSPQQRTPTSGKPERWRSNSIEVDVCPASLYSISFCTGTPWTLFLFSKSLCETILLQLLLFNLYGVIPKLIHVLLSENNMEDIMEMNIQSKKLKLLSLRVDL